MKYQVEENCLTIFLPGEMGRYKLVYLLGGEVWAVHANERMKKILTMSGVTKIIQMYEEETI